MRLRRLSIRSKLILTILSVSFLVMFVGGITTFWFITRQAKKDLIRQTQLQARLTSVHCAVPLDFDYPDRATEVLEKLAELPHVKAAVLYTHDKKLFASWIPDSQVVPPQRLDKNAGYWFDKDLLYVADSIAYADKHQGFLWLVVETNFDTLLSRYIKLSLLLALLMIILSVSLSLSLQGIISGPIVRLADFARKVSAEEDYSLRIKKTSSDETGVLYDNFNHMLEVIRQREELSNKVWEELKESEQKLKAVINNSPSIIYMKDLYGVYMLVNSEFEIFSGKTADHIIGKTDMDVFDADTATRFAENDKLVISEKQVQHFEEEATSTEGKVQTFLSIKFPISDNRGEMYALCGISTDISDRKQFENQLLESKTILQATFEASHNGILVVNDKGLITHYNQYLLAMWNIPSPMTETSFDQLYTRYIKRHLRESRLFEGIMTRTGVDRNFRQLTLYLDTGQILLCETTSLLNAAVTGRVWFFTDISNQRKREDEIRRLNEYLEERVKARTKELEAAVEQLKQTQSQLVHSEKMASLGVLTAGIAHEINNPVNYILSSIYGLGKIFEDLIAILDRYQALCHDYAAKNGVVPPDESIYPEIKNNVRVLTGNIVVGAERTAEIVRGLRTFARIDESDYKSADLHESLDSTLTILRPQYKSLIEIKRDYGQIPLVYCYPGQINQLFMNILANAIDAILAKPAPLQNEEIEISTFASADNSKVTIRITDTGPGVPETVRTKIFDPFFTTKDVGKGTGLGLSISLGIVQKHKGTIDVQNIDGKGACFQITFPVNPFLS